MTLALTFHADAHAFAAAAAPYLEPKGRRGRGYASNVTAKLSHELLDAGKEFTTIYTDASNPTSNSSYQSIGYRPVAEEVVLVFD